MQTFALADWEFKVPEIYLHFALDPGAHHPMFFQQGLAKHWTGLIWINLYLQFSLLHSLIWQGSYIIAYEQAYKWTFK